MNPEVTPLIDAALRGALIALLLLLGFRLWRDRVDSTAARICSFFLLCLCVQVVSSTPLFEARVPCLWQSVPIGISVGNAVLFWLFVSALFDDEFRLKALHAAVWLAVVALGVMFCFAKTFGAPVLSSAALFGMRWVPLVFALLAVAAAARQWSADLVEPRRRVRVFVAVAGSIYTIGMVGARLAAGSGQLAGAWALVDMAALLFVMAVVAANVLGLRRSGLFAPQAINAHAAAPASSQDPAQIPSTDSAAELPSTVPDPAEDALLERLAHAMGQEHAYRLENLTIASLASKLGVAEYRLRRAINGRLGHRNFNAYVNGFRLQEAQQALADPAKRALPVLTIALTAGFQSIGPFNRAFKAATDLTPTEFREKHLADS